MSNRYFSSLFIIFLFLVTTCKKNTSVNNYIFPHSPSITVTLLSEDDFDYRIKYNYNGKTIKIESNDAIRGIYLSADKHYTMITIGTDVIGAIHFFDNETEQYVLKENYSGDEPVWNNNIVTYEAVKYFGWGCSIIERHSFTNGIVQKSEQYFGEYHGLGSEHEAPFCSGYTVKTYPNLPKLLDSLKRTCLNLKEYFPDNCHKINHLLIKGISRDNVLQLITESNNILALMAEKKLNYYIPDYISDLIPIIDRSVEMNFLSKKEKYKFQDIILEIIDIDKSIVPWLYQ